MKSRLQKTARVLAVISLVAALLTGCEDRPQELPDIRIGLIAPLSGSLEESGREVARAIRFMADKVNARGGLTAAGGPRRITLVVEDNQDNVQAAVAAAQKLINQKGVVALIGAPLSRNAIPIGAVAEKARIPFISPTSTHPDTTSGRSFTFRAAYTDTFQGRVLARFAKEHLKTTRVAVLFDAANIYNRSLAQYFRAAYQELGGQVVAFQFYTSGEKDFRKQLARIKAAEPEVLFLPNYVDDLPDQIDQIGELEMEAMILGTDSWSSIPDSELNKLTGCFFGSLWFPNLEDDRTREFMESYEEKFGARPKAHEALSYDAMGLLLAAIGGCQNLEPEEIRNQLAQVTDYQGVSGSISFQGGGDPIKSVAILKIEDGRKSLLKVVESNGH